MDGIQNTQPTSKNAYKLACTLKIRGGCERDSMGKRAGKGPLVQWEKSGTLGVSQDQTLFVWLSATDLTSKAAKGERTG